MDASTGRLGSIGEKLGLRIIKDKTKAMKNIELAQPITIESSERRPM